MIISGKNGFLVAETECEPHILKYLQVTKIIKIILILKNKSNLK